MQAEFDIQFPNLDIAIIGVNEAGHEVGNSQITEGRDLPWLQDTSAANWWGRWSPTYRDVLILDSRGELAGIYNLTDNSLTITDNYVELKSMIVDIAEAQ